MRPHPRAAVAVAVALSPLGTVAGHVAGYGLAGRPVSFHGSHAHLGPGAWLTAALAGVALAWVAVSRRSARARPPLSWLAGGQAAAYVVLEVAERLVGRHGLGHLPGDPSLRWGLVAQVAVATVLVLAVKAARATGERVRAALTARVRAAGTAGPPPRPCGSADLRTRPVVSPATERGPPPRLAPV